MAEIRRGDRFDSVHNSLDSLDIKLESEDELISRVAEIRRGDRFHSVSVPGLCRMIGVGLKSGV